LIISTVRHAERERKGEGKRGFTEETGSPESMGHKRSKMSNRECVNFIPAPYPPALIIRDGRKTKQKKTKEK
jgi:hypothetical protein